MKNNLLVRRQKLLRQLERLNRQIATTQQGMIRLQSRMAILSRAATKAA